MQLVAGADGVTRCWWGAEPEIYRDYHDSEWGRAVTDDTRLFEKICLEGFQSGLSWLTILRKRENFRNAFDGFDPGIVARYGEQEIERLLDDDGIVRHAGKIRSTINNASRALELIKKKGSLSDYFWSWAEPETAAPTSLEATTPVSTALAKDLKQRGWSFVGPTTAYAFMQAMGLVNDHLDGCDARDECAATRRHAIDSFL